MSLPAYEALRLPRGATSHEALRATPSAHSGPPGPRRLAASESPRTAPRSAVLRLVGAERGCAEARDFVRRTLTGWELEQCGPDALIVVTELLANAVLHAAPHSAAHPSADPGIWLRLSVRRPAHLVCAVTDPSDHPPVYPHTSDPFDEHGRGLRIIDSLSEHWGWTRRHPMGKTVWAMLPTTESC